MKLLTTGQLAKLLGVSARTVGRWLKRGCPSVLVDGERRFDPAAVETWQDAQEPDDTTEPAGAAVPGSAPTVRDPLRQADVVRRVNEAKRSEMDLAAERGLKDLGFDATILAARTFDDYAAIDRQVAALLARGAMSPDRARAIEASIANARQNTKAHREADDSEDLERFVLASEDVVKIAEAFEGIVSDERRARIVAHVVAEAAVDLAEHPNVDLADGLPDEPETATGDEEPA